LVSVAAEHEEVVAVQLGSVAVSGTGTTA